MTLSDVSQPLMCTRISWRSCQDADSNSVGLGWNGKVCTSHKFPEKANAVLLGITLNSEDLKNSNNFLNGRNYANNYSYRNLEFLSHLLISKEIKRSKI